MVVENMVRGDRLELPPLLPIFCAVVAPHVVDVRMALLLVVGTAAILGDGALLHVVDGSPLLAVAIPKTLVRS